MLFAQILANIQDVLITPFTVLGKGLGAILSPIIGGAATILKSPFEALGSSVGTIGGLSIGVLLGIGILMFIIFKK